MSSDRFSFRTSVLLLFTFVVSGAAGMVHELSWSRQLAIRLGQTSEAITLVLVAYFGGLALGSFLAPWLLTRTRGLRIYGAAEIVCGVWAMAFPLLLEWLSHARRLAEAPWPVAACGSNLDLLLLMIPATASLGLTLPAFVDSLERRTGNAGLSNLAYGLNTLGGLIGIIASVAGLFVALGVATSSQTMGLIQILCGVLALWISRSEGLAPLADAEPKGPRISDPPRSLSWRSALIIAFFSGFTILSLELLHLRFYSFIFHNSTFSFALALGAVILGLALAPLAASASSQRTGHRRPLNLGVALAPLLAPLLLILFVHHTELRRFEHCSNFSGYLLGAAQLVTTFTLPLFLVLGLVLPATWGVLSERGLPQGRTVGMLSGASSLGAAIGAYLSNSWLLPAFGVVGSLAMLTVPMGVSMCAAGLRMPIPAILIAASLATCAGLWHRLQVRPPGRSLEVVERWESAYGWVDLLRCRDHARFMEIRQNVHYVLGNTAARRSEARQGHLPLLLHPDPHRVLFIGLGTGLSALPAVGHPGIEAIRIVELIPDVVSAARRMGPLTRPLFDDARVQIVAADGRHHLETAAETHDVIVSDLFVPWESRTGYLYTQEFYDTVRDRLRPGGLFCQWLPLYQLGEKELEIILDTFASTFPVSTLWWCQIDARYPVLGMVGSKRPLVVDGELLEARMRLLVDQGVEDPWTQSSTRFLDLFAGRWSPRKGTTRNTDEHPHLEFSAPVTERDGRLMIGDRLRTYVEASMADLSISGLVARSAPGQSLSSSAERSEIVRQRLAAR